MSDTVTGLEALKAAIDRLPDEVTAALRGVAHRTAVRIQQRASALAPVDVIPPRGKYTEGEPHLKDSIVVEEDAAQKQFRIYPRTPWLPNLGLWIERGTVKLRARPFMRPAGDAATAQYQAEAMRAAASVAEKAFQERG